MSNIKIILLGEAGVGKTNLINVAIGHEFDPNINSTLNTTFIVFKMCFRFKRNSLKS